MTSTAMSQIGRIFLRRTILQTSARRSFKSSTTALTNAATEPQQTTAGGEPQHIKAIVDQISQLKFYEVTILNEALKRELKIPDVQRVVATGPAAAAGEEADGADGTAAGVKSAYTVKLTKFDDSKKVALIKEIKKLVEGMNLVEAKRFVEECPKVIRANVSKDEADALQKQLEAAGGVVKVE